MAESAGDWRNVKNWPFPAATDDEIQEWWAEYIRREPPEDGRSCLTECDFLTVLARICAEQKRAKEAFNEGVEAAAQRVLNGSFLHDEAPTALFAREAAKAIRALKRSIEAGVEGGR